MIELLSAYLSIYYIPTDESFYDHWDDANYDLAVLDEFRGQKTVQWLNLWLQGGVMCLPKKGSQYIKKYNVPTIILSNYELADIYKKANYDSLEARLEIVYVNDFIKITFD